MTMQHIVLTAAQNIKASTHARQAKPLPPMPMATAVVMQTLWHDVQCQTAMATAMEMPRHLCTG